MNDYDDKSAEQAGYFRCLCGGERVNVAGDIRCPACDKRDYDGKSAEQEAYDSMVILAWGLILVAVLLLLVVGTAAWLVLAE